MKGITFKGQNVVFAENQDEYISLPALRIEDNVITCWRLSFKERLVILFTGRLWLNMLTFNKPLTPIFMSVKRKDVFSLSTDKERKETK